MSGQEEGKLVRTAEAARALSLDPSTLARWARQGIIRPAFRTAGGQARWDMSELQRQVADHLRDQDEPGAGASSGQ